MKERDFILWLHGFFEISQAKTLNENQVRIIKDHLETFFVKVTPQAPSTPDLNKLAEEAMERFKERQKENRPRQPIEPLRPLLPIQPMYPEWPGDKIMCELSTDESAPAAPTAYC